HGCGKRLNIKAELAGRRGICPKCQVRFRIPLHDCPTSTPVTTAEPASQNKSSANGALAVGSQRHEQVAVPNGVIAATATNADVARAGDSNGSHASSTAEPANGKSSSDRVIAKATQKSNDTIPIDVTTNGNTQDPFGGLDTTWYVRPPSGGQYGPADGPTMQQWLSQGRVAEVSMVWRDGWPDWRSAQGVFANAPEAPWHPQFAESHLHQSSIGVASASTADAVTADQSAESPVERPAVASAQTDALVADLELKARGGPLPTNQRNRSRKRLVLSILMGIVFLGLVSALVGVVMYR
ncbi:MAG: DUF4339 domain-containing protein, partial [Planctomycetota bacterium]